MLGTILAFIVTGYGMTKGFMDLSLADRIHTHYLPVLLVFAFSIHTLYAIHLAFKRWGVWGNKEKVFLALAYAVFLVFFLFIEIIYGKLNKFAPSTKKSPSTLNSATQTVPRSDSENNIEDNSNSINTNQNQSNTTNSQKTFTSEELSQYNGQNGQPAYVAVDGTVYDVTSLFYGGRHHMHFAGQDLTSNYFGKHGSVDRLQGYPVVGKMK